jgi:hypothetical protein
MPSLSPLSVSESSDMPTVPTATLSPSTPCTPAQPTFAVVPGQPEHMDMAGGCAPQPLIYSHPQHMVMGGYPGAHFAQPMYPGYEYVQGPW